MEKESVKNIRISFIINVLIVIMTIIALTISFTGFKFMNGYEPASELTQTQMFNFFTVQSNTFMGIVSFFMQLKNFNF